MGVSNEELSKIALAQGYHPNAVGKGVCYGATALAGQAVLLRKVDEYNQRLEAVHETYVAKKASIDSWQQKTDFSAFFQSLAIHNRPRVYSSQLPTDSQPIQQFQDMEKTMSLMASVELDKKGGISKQIHFLGKYSNADGIREYLHSLNDAILTHSADTKGKPIEFFLSIGSSVPITDKNLVVIEMGGHGVMLAYTREANEPHGTWYFYNTNGVTVLDDANQESTVYRIVAISEDDPNALIQLEKWLDYSYPAHSYADGLTTTFYSFTNSSKTLKKISNNFLERLAINEKARIARVMKTTPSHLYQELSFSAAQGHLDLVTMLLESLKEEINRNDEKCHKVLIEAFVGAASHGHIKIVPLFLKQGIQIDEKDEGCTALMRSAENGQLDMIDFLIGKNADINAVSTDGYTPLMFAAQNGHLEGVKFLIAKNANLNATTPTGINALMLAAENGHTDVVQQLLQCGADFNAVSNDGNTALTLAVKNGHVETVQLLFEKGDHGENRALLQQLFRLAAKQGQIEVLKYLLLPFANQEILYLILSSMSKDELLEAIKEIQPEINDEMLEKMDISALHGLIIPALKQHPPFPITSIRDENSLVFYVVSEEVKSAVKNNAIETVDSLLTLIHNYCDVSEDIYNKLLMELILIAIDNKNIDLIVHILEENAKQKETSMDEDAVMMYATKKINSIKINSAKQQHLSIEQEELKEKCESFLKILGELCGNNDKFKKIYNKTVRSHISLGIGQLGFIFFTAHERRTALMGAAEQGDLIMVKDFVINKGAKVDARTTDGRTPLMFAAANGHLAVVKFLIESGADVNGVSRPGGHTALSLASKQGHVEVADFLKDAIKAAAAKANKDRDQSAQASSGSSLSL